MATLSVLSYNQTTQGGLVKMKVNTSNNNNTNNINSNITTTTHTPTTNTITSPAVSKTFTKITVQNVLSENNGNLLNITNNLSSSNNTIVRKIKDFGMFGTVNASTGNASNRSASSLTSGNNVRKRPLPSTEAKEKPSATNVSKVKPVSNKKVKVIKESKKDSAKVSNTGTKATIKERQTDKVCIPRLKNVLEGAKPPGTPGRKGLPLPLAVARRNARERNRVKQVNNGFAALREKIPEEVAEAFEAQGNGRGSVKKLSKVETLRMAVEYIRSLERLLGFDFPIPDDLADGGMSLLQGGSCDEDSFTLIKDEFDALSPSMDDQFDDSLSNYDMEDYFNSNAMSQSSFIEQNTSANVQTPNQIDMLPNITTLNGLQYIRIPGTNTYQLLTPDIFIGSSNSPPNSSAEEEQFGNVIDVNCQSPSTVETSNATADLHVTPPSIMTDGTRTPAAGMSNIHIGGECTSASSASSSSLSRSPVPQISSPVSSSSPNAHTITSTSTNTITHTTTNILHHTQIQSSALAGAQTPTAIALSPAANELLLRTCAIATSSPANAVDATVDDDLNVVSNRQFVTPTTLPHFNLLPQSHMIKQEYIETDFVSPLTAESASAALMYPAMQQDESQQRQFLLDHATSLAAVSPPLDQANNNSNNNNSKCMSSALLLPNATSDAVGLQAFYEHEQNGNFYESVVAFKKELSDSMLETGSNCHSGNTPTLSDESMIDTIDWWEAHTPKSDGGGSVIL